MAAGTSGWRPTAIRKASSELDTNGKLISHRQIPLGPKENGGGCHGVEYVDGKLYIAALRLRGILRVDAKTWQPEFFINYNVAAGPWHGL